MSFSSFRINRFGMMVDWVCWRSWNALLLVSLMRPSASGTLAVTGGV